MFSFSGSFPTAAAASAANPPDTIINYGLPLCWVGSGTMGNNGAITLTSATQRILGSCYLKVPAGSIAAGVPAASAWYYCVMSSTTVGTLYNNTWDGASEPAIPASPTAFVTTGPGAFTGGTAEEVMATLPIAAFGANTVLRLRALFEPISNGSNKYNRIYHTGTSGTKLFDQNMSGLTYTDVKLQYRALGIATKQIAFGEAISHTAADISYGPVFSADANGAAFNLVLTWQKVAADNWVMMGLQIDRSE